MKTTQPLLITPHANDINIEHWLSHLFSRYASTQNPLLHQAATLAQLTGSDCATITGQSCLEHGTQIADVLLGLNVDQETLAAALLYPCVIYADLSIDDVAEQTNPVIAKLVRGVKKMDTLRILSEQNQKTFSKNTLDNVRKMLLAIVDDVRIVLIKLAEKLVVLRNISLLSTLDKQHEAKITQDIYAPLANRLGIGQLKWELEDLSLRYLNPDIYNSIYQSLDSTRSEREQYVKTVISLLKTEANKLAISPIEVTGRAKHIYSIYKKMTRKKVAFSEIYDVIAFRLLVTSIEDCYALLGHVHSLWTPISKEFDDYITQQKSNGYQSIHTAVIGPENTVIEIQIRTFDMHQHAELGVAAHWIYKEGAPIKTGYEAKITWLRQVMEWQTEMSATEDQKLQTHLFDDHIYVFTPQGDVIELIKDATPLDFAYHIHTGLGHRCRGAKVGGHIVPLTYHLKMGDCVDIIATKEEHPSRDWLSPSLGYLKTSRAKSKVLHWFRIQNAEQNLLHGKTMLEKELKRLGIKKVDQEKLVQKMHLPSIEDLWIALGRGDTTLIAIIHAIQSLIEPIIEKQEVVPVIRNSTSKPSTTTGTDIDILGIGNLLTHMATCCHPIPGDPIIGYVTQRQGISIHRQDCTNFLHMQSNAQQKARTIEVSWGEKTQQQYKVNLVINAYDRYGLIRDVTQILVSENLSILGLNCAINQTDHTAHITLNTEMNSLQPLSRILARIIQLPNVIEARRV